MARTVFITGAYGLLGAWIARACLDRGDEVVVLRRTAAPASALVLDGLEARCTVVPSDLLAPGLLERVLAEHGVDVVLHLAGQSVVDHAMRSPVQAFETNVRGTWLLMEACRRADRVVRVVVASSEKAYGGVGRPPYAETQALHARHPYDASKAAADLIARSYWPTYGVPVAVARLSNVYGGGDRTRSRLVPEAIAAVLEGRRPQIRSDGSPVREILYAQDAAAAYLALADALEAGRGCGDAFNAGGGQPHRVRDIVGMVCEVAGVADDPDVLGAPVGADAVDRQYLDSTRLRELTGWRPRVDLREGLRRTLAWYEAHPAALDLTYTRPYGRTFEVGGDQAQEGDRRREARQALHQARTGDHGGREGGRGRP